MAEGNIHMTVEELNTFVNARIAEAIAANAQAHQQGQQVPVGGPVIQPVCTFKAFLDCKPHHFK